MLVGRHRSGPKQIKVRVGAARLLDFAAALGGRGCHPAPEERDSWRLGRLNPTARGKGLTLQRWQAAQPVMPEEPRWQWPTLPGSVPVAGNVVWRFEDA